MNDVVKAVDALCAKLVPMVEQLSRLVVLMQPADELTDGEHATEQLHNDEPTLLARGRPRRRAVLIQNEGAVSIRIAPRKKDLTTAKGALVVPGDTFEDETHTGEWWGIATAAGPVQVNVVEIFRVEREREAIR